MPGTPASAGHARAHAWGTSAVQRRHAAGCPPAPGRILLTTPTQQGMSSRVPSSSRHRRFSILSEHRHYAVFSDSEDSANEEAGDEQENKPRTARRLVHRRSLRGSRCSYLLRRVRRVRRHGLHTQAKALPTRNPSTPVHKVKLQRRRSQASTRRRRTLRRHRSDHARRNEQATRVLTGTPTGS